MGVDLLNRSSYEFLSSSKSFECTLGKRKYFSFSSFQQQPPKKERRLFGPTLEDGFWDIISSSAKQPNLEVIRSCNGKVMLSNLSFMPSAKPRVYKTIGLKEGEGTYGLVFTVIDIDNPEKELVMKISVANSNFFAEVSALNFLNSKKTTPNVPQLHDWFITDKLPPNSGHWGKISDSLKKSSQFKNISKYPVGYLILEKANAGALASFTKNHCSGYQKDIWKLVDSILFQLLFTASALPESSVIHRDIGGYNIMLTSTDDIKENYLNFRVGKQLFRFEKQPIKPLLIDYGTANILEIGSSLKTDFRYTTLRYRAPEMIFLSSKPTGTLQPIFTPATDLFSIAMSVIEMVLGDFTEHKDGKKYYNHPFMSHNPPPLLHFKLKQLSKQLQIDENNFKIDCATRMWYGTLHSGFLTVDESLLLSRYIWGMYMELGIPNNRMWPGVEDTHVWSIMNEVIQNQKRLNLVYPTEGGLLLRGNGKLRQLLSEDQISCLLSMLRFNPKHRPSPAAILKSEIFDEYSISPSEVSTLSSAFWSVSGTPLQATQQF
mmetsp:Transcript_7344/g.15306  ORF Transcript_7344/g.15306 Transcript_7344/m.15306 type:complete len:546 (+) Transcript_7344:1-1638(+)